MKLFNYMFLIIGLMILFNAAGLPTASSVVLEKLGMISPESVGAFSSSIFKIELLAALVALAAVGLTGSVSFFGTGGSWAINETSITAGIASLLFIFFIGDLVSISQKLNESGGWIGWVGFLIMLPIIAGFILAVYDWVRKVD